jgi:hypothetical protein
MSANVNTNIDDKLFYFYGVKPLEKEIANFDKKVCEYLMNALSCSRVEAFVAWQQYKMNVKLTHIANFPIMIVGNDKPQDETLASYRAPE